MNVASRSLIIKNKIKKVLIKTSKGDIIAKLYENESPNTVSNFLRYIKDGQYNNTIFHRIISNFMIQGGEYKADGTQNKPKFAPIKSESNNGLKNQKGTLSMARNSHPDSAKAQFFINTRNNKNLDYKPNKEGYTVFGEVIEGMDVVNSIRLSKTNNKNWPHEPTKIIEIKEFLA